MNIIDEQELQGLLGGILGKVKWSIGPKPEALVHNGIIYRLYGGEDGDTVLVCSCGWAMRFDRSVRLKQAEETFVEHVDGRFDG